MNYDAAATRRLGINPKSWTWFNIDYSKYSATNAPTAGSKTTTVRQLRPVRFVLFLAALTLHVAVSLSVGSASGQGLISAVAICIGSIIAGILCNARPVASKIIGFLIIGLPIIGASLAAAALHSLLYVIAASILAAGAWWVGRLLKSSTSLAIKAVDEPSQSVVQNPWNTEHRVFGRPGGVADSASKYGQKAVDAGVQGEESTATLLNYLLKIPGTNIFHGLRFPGSENADVDHAVTHGNMVYLIDSKQWRWGEYEWLCVKNGDEIIRSDGYGRGKRNHMDTAAARYKEILGPGIDVVPLVVMHGGNVKIGKNRTSCTGVTLLTANEAMELIGNNLAERMSHWQANENVTTLLFQHLK